MFGTRPRVVKVRGEPFWGRRRKRRKRRKGRKSIVDARCAYDNDTRSAKRDEVIVNG